FNFHEYQAGIPGFGVMRVFGDEVFTPNGTGYNMHPHHNFIIMAFVLAGAPTHINTIRRNDRLGRAQPYLFSAGAGGKHSELNIGEGMLGVIYVWVLPAQLLAPPSYRRACFDRNARANRITCLVGDAPSALPISQTFKVSRLVSDGDRCYAYRPARSNGLYAFVVEGEVEIADAILTRRDSMALEGEDEVAIAVRKGGTDVLLVETQL